MDILNTPTVKPVKPIGFRKIAKLFNDVEANAINSREIHAFMNVGRDYSNWIKGRLKELRAVENFDYTLANFGEQDSHGGSNKNDYIVTNYIAEHLGMLERNDIGFQIRDYFIFMKNLAIYLMQKKVEECDIKTEKKITSVRLKADKTIQRLIDDKTKMIDSYYARPRGNGWETITRIIKDHKLSLSPEMANSFLSDKKIIKLHTDKIPVTYWVPSSESAIASGGSILLHTPTVMDILAEYVDVENRQPTLF